MMGNIPTTVLILVHGTFARGSAWASTDSFFRRNLASQVKGEVVFKPFEWSGANSHQERLLAAEHLQQFIRRSLSEDGEAAHFVVGHSHGGNVIFYALRDDALAERINGTICMATPFIMCEQRYGLFPFAKHEELIFSMANTALFVVPLVLIATAMLIGSPLVMVLAAITTGVYCALCWILSSVGGLFGLTERWYYKGYELSKRLELPLIKREKLFIVSVSGDEALWWLKRLTRWSELPFFVWSVACHLFAFGLLGGIPLAVFLAFRKLTIWDFLANILIWYLGVFAFAEVLLLLVALMFVLPSVLRAPGYGYGGESFSDNVVAKITARRVPGWFRRDRVGLSSRDLRAFLGTCVPRMSFKLEDWSPLRLLGLILYGWQRPKMWWRVHRECEREFKRNDNRVHCRMSLFKVLRHCKVYDDAIVVDEIALWINSLSKRSE